MPAVKTWYNGFGPQIRSESFAWTKAQIAAGLIQPPCQCQACGETQGHIDFHTEDYSRPFGPHIYAHEVCFRCHMCIHARFRRPGLWYRYIEQIEAGAVYRPLMNRREIGAIAGSTWVEHPITWTAPRPRQEFFRSLTMERRSAAQSGYLFD